MSILNIKYERCKHFDIRKRITPAEDAHERDAVMQADLFLNLPPTPLGVPLWQHIRQSIINMIRRGDLQPGEPLPAHGELCEQVGVSHVTMQRILSSLAREGWIVRYRRRGTFVAETLPDVRNQVIAVIARGGFEEQREGFDRLVFRAIHRIFQEAEQQFRLYPEHVAAPPKSEDQPRLSLDDALISDIESGRVEGLLLVRPADGMSNIDATFRQRLIDHGVPVVAVNAWAPLPYAASTCCVDYHALYDRAFGIMQVAERRRIGLLCQSQDETVVAETLLAAAHRAARGRGIEGDIVHLPLKGPLVEETGHRAISEYLDGKRPPLDGLVISDDVLAKGVASALVRRGVTVPESMLVVTQGNKGSGLTYPLPFIRLEFDIDKLLRTAWEQFVQFKRGYRSTRGRIMIPPDPCVPPELEELSDLI